MQPTSPSLAGGFSTSEPLEKPLEKESCGSAKTSSLLQAVNSIVPNGSIKTPVTSKLSINRARPPKEMEVGMVIRSGKQMEGGRVWGGQPQLFTQAHV